ncbi:7TM-DISM domain-containing protein [Sphingobacterium sp. E70]|uniref:7TMR-DISMED2 domain-containing protein n=1 Tax=Sphingobacterium sp. E70 TaxID=2853439 RepID=UPI002795A9BD|nr:7TM-DISM domain-containing protein [Sphingobacterium sp. E70]
MPDAIWLRLPVKNNTKQDLDLLLEIAYPLLDEIELYSPNENGTYQSIRLGEHQNFSLRKYKVPNYLFDIHLHCQSEKVFFSVLKVLSKSYCRSTSVANANLWRR